VSVLRDPCRHRVLLQKMPDVESNDHLVMLLL
jgi:hypothetical protein